MVNGIFNPMDPRYRCCCGCHVTLGTKILCCLSFFACIFSGGFTALTGATFTENNPTFINVALVWIAIISIVCLLPIYGIYKKQPGWIIPYLVLIVIGLVFVGITLASIIVALIPNTTFGEQLRASARAKLPYETKADHDFTHPLIFLLIQNIISFGLSCWYFMIVLRCYQYLVEFKNDNNIQRMHSPTSILISK
uniref:DUF7027 domain-containing protein n=1 Tax=Panagrolaimus davidi TaxID=227884 RepID=A0A914NY75_9BILA